VRQEVLTPVVGSGARPTQLRATLSPTSQSRFVRPSAVPSAVPWARRVLGHMLRAWQLENISDTALLLLSELVTNAVQASGDSGDRHHGDQQMIAFTLQLTDTSLVMEVWDTNPALPVLQESDITGDHGRGLLLVDFMADQWGHRAENGGKVVWCKVAIRA
jgi:anti-sigma regulatory factor (Ser/Thr protein kinase)